jgi:predicted dehydrogenase
MVGGGRGAFFAGYHRAAMRLCNRYDIVAGAFSSDPTLCREAGESFGVSEDRIYADFRQMAQNEARREDRIDVAIIVTPNHLHFEPCKLFLEAGIPVICDKPLVNDLDEARELVRLAEKNGTFFAVTYTYTGYPMVRDAKARIRNGELGEIRFMYVEYLLEWLAEGTSNLGAKSSSWRVDPAKAGPTGVVGDIGTHAFNMLEFLSGRRCEGLNAKLTSRTPGWPLDDNAVVQLEFEGGADGLLWVGLAAPGHRNGLRFKIVGTKASLEWKQEAPETLLLGRLGEADVIYRRGQRDMTPEGKASVSLPAGNPEAYLEALAILYADYAKALEAGPNWRTSLVTPVTDVHDGLRGVALSKACLDSNEKRAWVRFPGGEGE